MKKFAVYRIGRAEGADIRLADASVSRLHAELLITADGRFFLTDCRSSGGTRIRKSGERQWLGVQQSWVTKTDSVQLGQHQTSIEELLLNIKDSHGAGKLKGPGGTPEPTSRDELPEGPVRRDLATGEILKQED